MQLVASSNRVVPFIRDAGEGRLPLGVGDGAGQRGARGEGAGLGARDERGYVERDIPS